jgi:hypothetical protein
MPAFCKCPISCKPSFGTITDSLWNYALFSHLCLPEFAATILHPQSLLFAVTYCDLGSSRHLSPGLKCFGIGNGFWPLFLTKESSIFRPHTILDNSFQFDRRNDSHESANHWISSKLTAKGANLFPIQGGFLIEWIS